MQATFENRETFNVLGFTKGTFPDEQVPDLKPTLEGLCERLLILVRRMNRCLAVALGLNEDYFDEAHKV